MLDTPTRDSLEDVDLPSLIEKANQIIDTLITSEASTLDLAIEAGFVLHRIRERVLDRRWQEVVGDEPQSWDGWVATNLKVSTVTANSYMRLASFEATIRQGECRNLTEAKALIAGIPDPYRPRGGQPATRAERRQQASMQARRRKRDTAARKALRREEEKKAARMAGNGIDVAFACVRKLEEALAAARGMAEKPEVRQHLDGALGRLGPLEDEIVRASRMS